MLQGLWLIPLLPLAGFLILLLAGGSLSRRGMAVVGVGSVGVSAVVTILVGLAFLRTPPPGGAYSQDLWGWMEVAGFSARIGLRLDALSLVMALVVTGVGFLIHLYSAEFMAADDGYRRFFASMNLFVASMLVLVLADNLLLLYLGWEGVGLCSYLLIGFWYKNPGNGYAARKAFVVTRVGDAAMAVGLFLLATRLGTLEIQTLMERASRSWTAGSGPAVAAAALLLAGALGKSAQVPLQTWLPDAMAGPTPVSALIHAATMVTAGVYLIARTHVLFDLAPAVQAAVAAIGALTLLLAGCSALAQRDIKRVLAYSTISQIGYMFLALGVGAWSAAMFHFLTHAFFKALLFLGAGVVILTLHHEHDIFRMGGLRRRLPVIFWTFLIASASLAGFPLVTSGFYSKDWILWEAWASPAGGPWLWGAGLLGALITGLYAFRLVFLVFFGDVKTEPIGTPGSAMQIPVIVLATLSVVTGFLELPRTLGDLPLFSHFLQGAPPAAPPPHGGVAAELALQGIAAAASLAGIALASLLFLRRSRVVERLTRPGPGEALHRFWRAGWGFDRLYDRMLVRPVLRIAEAGRDDVCDGLSLGVARLGQLVYLALSGTQTGQVRRYAAVIAAGVVFIVAMLLLS